MDMSEIGQSKKEEKPKKETRGRKRKFTSDCKALVIEYVKTYGTLVNCASILPIVITEKTIQQYLNPSLTAYYDADFHAAIQQAYRDYKTIHLDVSNETNLHEEADKQFFTSLKVGDSATTEFFDDQNALKWRKLFKRPGIQKWMWDALHPPKNFAEEAIATVVASQTMAVTTWEMSDEARAIIGKFLHRWTTEELRNLQMQGKPLKRFKDMNTDAPLDA